MVFTDTIKYLSGNRLPIISLDVDQDRENLATLMQDSTIKIWDVYQIYCWEEILRYSIRSEEYDNDRELFKPVSTIETTAFNQSLTMVKFSHLRHLIKRNKSVQSERRSIEATSKLDSTKKIKVSIKSINSEINSPKKPIYILALSSDIGQISFASPETDIGNIWSIFHSFNIPVKLPILDLVWSLDDSKIAVAAFSLDIYIYQIDFKNVDKHTLLFQTTSIANHPPRQLIWHPTQNNLLTIIGKESVYLWDIEKKINAEKIAFAKQKKQMRKKEKGNNEEIQFQSNEDDVYDTIEEDLNDFINCFSPQTSWSQDGIFLGLLDSNNSNEQESLTSPMKVDISQVKSFYIVKLLSNGFTALKFSRHLYELNKKKVYCFLAYRENKLFIYQISAKSSHKEVNPKIIIHGITKNFADFMWLDAYRILGLDDMGRVHYFMFTSQDLGEIIEQTKMNMILNIGFSYFCSQYFQYQWVLTKTE